MKKIKITYEAFDGICLSDGLIKSFVDSLVINHERYNLDYTVGNEMIIHEIRLRVARKEILVENLELWFNGEQLKIDQQGRMPKWPEGFCDFHEKQLYELVGF